MTKAESETDAYGIRTLRAYCLRCRAGQTQTQTEGCDTRVRPVRPTFPQQFVLALILSPRLAPFLHSPVCRLIFTVKSSWPNRLSNDRGGGGKVPFYKENVLLIKKHDKGTHVTMFCALNWT